MPSLTTPLERLHCSPLPGHRRQNADILDSGPCSALCGRLTFAVEFQHIRRVRASYHGTQVGPEDLRALQHDCQLQENPGYPDGYGQR